MARPLPPQGFYVSNIRKWLAHQKFTQEQVDRVLAMPERVEVIYSSGTTKGNYYYSPDTHSDQWNHLTWTCLPSVKEAAACYDYHATNPTAKELPQ